MNLEKELELLKREVVLNEEKGFCAHVVDNLEDAEKLAIEVEERLGYNVEVVNFSSFGKYKYVLGVNW